MSSSPSLLNVDCTDDQATRQIAVALENLTKLTDEIFTRANDRITQCAERVQQYQKRVAVVKQKISAIENSEEIPVITSPAEFPGKIHTGRPAVYDRQLIPRQTGSIVQEPQGFTQPFELPLKETLLRKNGFAYAFSRGKYTELLQIPESDDRFSSLLRVEPESQGYINIEDIYDPKPSSSTNAYQSNKGNFGESLLIYGQLDVKDAADPFTYHPAAQSLTDFDLPDVLPELTGVSKDAAFGGTLFGDGDDDEEDMFVAPRTMNFDVDLSAQSNFYVEEPMNRVASSTVTRSSSDRNRSVEKPPAPVPANLTVMSNPAPVPEVKPAKEVPSGPILPALPTTTSPPPPPPPPPPAPSALLSIPSPPMPSGRADLMASIRSFGGASKGGLKKIPKEDEAAPSTSAPAAQKSLPENSGDDLMASLAKALEKRRRDMSGKTQKKFAALEKQPNSSRPENSAFNSLREMIPPPRAEDSWDSDADDQSDSDWR